MTSRIKVQALSERHHAMMAGFDCGSRLINRYLSEAAELQKLNLSTTFIAVDAASKSTMLGFYSWHNMSISSDSLPASLGRYLRRGTEIGAIYLANIAVANEYQDKGIGTDLLRSALYRAKSRSTEIAAWAIVLDPINENAERFYLRLGFDVLENETGRLFLPISAI